jgi:hypothetical protein
VPQLFHQGGKSIEFRFIDQAKAEFPVYRRFKVWVLARAAISPVKTGQQASGNRKIW